MIRILFVALLATLSFVPSAPAADLKDVERTLFHTYMLAFPKGAHSAITAATKCAVDILSTAELQFPDALDRLVASDFENYSLTKRLDDMNAAFRNKYPDGFADCGRKLKAGDFGPTEGYRTAPSAPIPEGAKTCPYDATTTEGTKSCFCFPLEGGALRGALTYPEGTAICVAAYHAGVINALDGGQVEFAISAGCPSYTNSSAYGYVSSPGDAAARSFYFPAISDGACQ